MEYNFKAYFENKDYPVAHGQIPAASVRDAYLTVFGMCGTWRDENGKSFEAGTPCDVEIEEDLF